MRDLMDMPHPLAAKKGKKGKEKVIKERNLP